MRKLKGNWFFRGVLDNCDCLLPRGWNSFAGDLVESKHCAVEKLNKLLRINTEQKQKQSAGPGAAGGMAAWGRVPDSSTTTGAGCPPRPSLEGRGLSPWAWSSTPFTRPQVCPVVGRCYAGEKGRFEIEPQKRSLSFCLLLEQIINKMLIAP